ncbi:MAG: fatty acid desaturase [Bacteroidetes bacterium]|nr:fatty acid desaturase [Bacteroidota bacterium]
MSNDQNLKFLPDNADFSKSLFDKVSAIATPKALHKAKILLWVKLIFYFFLFAFAYLTLFLFHHFFFTLIINYMLIGFLGILLAFNSSHDAAHRTYSSSKLVNNIIYVVTFNLQGVNAYLWKIRHRASHHLFPNVDGCDSDIDDNPFLRLSPSQEAKWWFKYQAYYATLLYFLYTLQWIFVKDFIYLNKKNLANLKNQKHSVSMVITVFFWKIFYFFYLFALPMLIMNYSFSHILIAFLSMHVLISVFFVLTLIISHLCMETTFPKPDASGLLPYNYQEHQLAVSLDYHPTSKLANWIFGGFNSHSAHHLFHELPHTIYAKITPAIKETAKEFNYPYNELGILKAIKSHYLYLHKLGNAQ